MKVTTCSLKTGGSQEFKRKVKSCLLKTGSNNNNNNGFIYSWIKTAITKDDLIKNIYKITNSYKICITKMCTKKINK